MLAHAGVFADQIGGGSCVCLLRSTYDDLAERHGTGGGGCVVVVVVVVNAAAAAPSRQFLLTD